MPRADDPVVVVRAAVDGPSGRRTGHDLRRAAPGVEFVTVVPLGDVTDLRGLLTGLGPAVAEVVLVPAAGASTDEAVAVALHLRGEDFVFEVPTLAGAVTWAREGAARPDLEGTRVLVVGGAATLSAVRQALRA